MKFFKVLIPLALALLVLCAQLEAIPADSEKVEGVQANIGASDKTKDKVIDHQKTQSAPFLLDDEVAPAKPKPVAGGSQTSGAVAYPLLVAVTSMMICKVFIY